MSRNRAKVSKETFVFARSARFTTSVGGDRLLLTNESDAHILDGSIYVAIASALSPAVSWGGLLAQLSARHSEAEIRAALTILAQIGYVRPFSGPGDPPRDAWWEALGAEAKPRTVALDALCVTGRELVEQALASGDIGIADDAGVRIVLTDDYLRPELEAINAGNLPWMLAKPTGHALWLGPVFQPGRQPCWECLRWWLRMHRWKQWAFHGWRDGHYPPQPSVAHLPATLAIAAGMIATAAAAWLARGDAPELVGVLLTFDTITLTQTRHHLRPVPGCPRCGGGPPQPPGPLSTFVSNLTGVVNGLETSSRPAAGLFHAYATFVSPLPVRRIANIMQPGEAFGKGFNAEAAETACVAEALERYSFTWRGDEKVIHARLEDLGAIPPNAIAQFSEAQFRGRTAANRDRRSMFWVPVPLERETRIAWVEFRSLTTGRPRYVPAASVFFGYPFETDEPYFIPDSNGCAAGQTREEALAGALLELIERDALSLWWYNRAPRPSPRFDAIEGDLAQRIISALQCEGWTVEVLDVTTDLQIPAYVAIGARADGSTAVFGSAAHVCPKKALNKALAELSQIVYWKDRIPPNPELAEWLRVANTHLPEFEWLVAHGTTAPPDLCSAGPAEIVETCVASLARAGIETLWIDLTRPEIGLPVVRAMAPGLRNPWARFAPGRLYETPVALGWLPQPTAETALNPIRCMV